MPEQKIACGRAIYLFNRDLRAHDNELLARAEAECETVYPVFIFTPEQVDANRYMNVRSAGFMSQILLDLASRIPISIFHGDTIRILRSLVTAHKIEIIYNNIDVTPFALARSKHIAHFCSTLGIRFIQGNDVFFGRHVDLHKADGAPYLKFTPFYENAVKLVLAEKPARRVRGSSFATFPNAKVPDVCARLAKAVEFSHIFYPSRMRAVRAVKKFVSSGVDYATARDVLAANATLHISAYLHFGVLGPVEVSTILIGNRNRREIVRQLLWREFYLYIVWSHHTSYSKASISLPKNNLIRWARSPTSFERWRLGRTGCPVVDAGMRELLVTGYMQNRARMIVAQFLIYYLRLPWRLGEMYFAQQLTDYDYCNNLGGWLWSAGWEVYSNDWFRPMSMRSQTERFDPDGTYIRKWIPELAEVDPADLVDWSASYKKYPTVVAKYCEPLVSDLSAARNAGIEMYKRAHA